MVYNYRYKKVEFDLMDEIIDQIKGYSQRIQSASTLKELDEIFLELYGKSGLVTKTTEKFKDLSKEEVSKIAPIVIDLKNKLEDEINTKREEIKESGYKTLEEETLDLNEDVEIKKRTGGLHPLTQFENEIVDLFSKIGFALFEAPHIDSDFYNFEVLNIPLGHPARDLWDTLFIDKYNLNSEDNLLLRTHTSNAQVRIMEQNSPPVRMMVLDRCFRYENLDARHEHTFDQFELVYVDQNLSMANLQYLSEYFLKSVLGDDIKVRMRPKYYPFVEPGVGIDGTCIFCKGEGCRVCGGIGWLELGGAGMIHPTVIKNGGLDSKEYSGIAWGPGLERILMLKHGIEDLRYFRNGDLMFLERFKNKYRATFA